MNRFLINNKLGKNKKIKLEKLEEIYRGLYYE